MRFKILIATSLILLPLQAFSQSRHLACIQTYQAADSIELIRNEKFFDADSNVIAYVDYAYDGASLVYKTKKYHYYSPGTDSTLHFTWYSPNDSIRTATITTRKTRNTKTTEYAELLYGIIETSVFTTSWQVKGADSLVTESYALYNGDTVVHHYVFRKGKPRKHTITKNGMTDPGPEWTYDERNRLTSYRHYDPIFKTSITEKYAWHPNGSMALRENIVVHRDGQKNITATNYDLNGNEIMEESKLYAPDGREAIIGYHLTITDYEYENGLLVKETMDNTYGLSSSKTVTRYVYIFRE